MERTKIYRTVGVFLMCLIGLNGCLPVTRQVATGGSYTLEQAVIANGGGGVRMR